MNDFFELEMYAVEKLRYKECQVTNLWFKEKNHLILSFW